ATGVEPGAADEALWGTQLRADHDLQHYRWCGDVRCHGLSADVYPDDSWPVPHCCGPHDDPDDGRDAHLLDDVGPLHLQHRQVQVLPRCGPGDRDGRVADGGTANPGFLHDVPGAVPRGVWCGVGSDGADLDAGGAEHLPHQDCWYRDGCE